ncbi:hypothetical protein C0991_005391 [Blastosporella zonata]|nr:hypothetical protein C0991_005391 [Blastosporella zonata]
MVDINMDNDWSLVLFEAKVKQKKEEVLLLEAQNPRVPSQKALGKQKAVNQPSRVDMSSGLPTAKPTKILNDGPKPVKAKSGSHYKSLADVADAHPTNKDLIDEGLEGEIGV